MKTAIANLRKRLNRKNAALDVEEELQFHLEMLERQYARDGMSSTEARAAASTRFGDLERYKRQCVAISLRNSLLQRALKLSSILFILAGLAISAFSSNFKVARIGHLFILNAILGRIFLYVRTRKRECS
jgi:hypothetical protein